MIERGCILCDGPNLLVEHLPEDLVRNLTRTSVNAVEPMEGSAEQPRHSSAVSSPVKDERQELLDALEQAGGNKSKAARLLSIDRSTLYRKMKRLDIQTA